MTDPSLFIEINSNAGRIGRFYWLNSFYYSYFDDEAGMRISGGCRGATFFCFPRLERPGEEW